MTRTDYNLRFVLLFLICRLRLLRHPNRGIKSCTAIAVGIQLERVDKRVMKRSRAALALETRIGRTFQCGLFQHRMSAHSCCFRRTVRMDRYADSYGAVHISLMGERGIDRVG